MTAAQTQPAARTPLPAATRTVSTRPSSSGPGSGFRELLRGGMPIPGSTALVLGTTTLATVCAAAEVVQRLTGWTL